jgi:hypothetical protein
MRLRFFAIEKCEVIGDEASLDLQAQADTAGRADRHADSLWSSPSLLATGHPFTLEVSPMCKHVPHCPQADAPDAWAAHAVASHPEQGWSLLCNGVVLFDDGGELLPGGISIVGWCTRSHREAA